MIRIETPTFADLEELTAVAKQTFVQSHGHSASKNDVDSYLEANYSVDIFKAEINNPDFVYRVLFYNNELVGYSKVVYNNPISAINEMNITKLDRIYILEKFHGSGLGVKLFNYNINLAKDNGQLGIWLFTWIENKRAIGFYEKMGFKIVGSYDFKLSANHTNPNHQMYLKF